MSKKRFRIMEDVETNKKHIVDMSNGEPLNLDETCILLNTLIKELHLAHMRSMFSTVKSFKGDISKRYKYDEKTDTIYDTANHYGQYNKILDKKEITMLLNEYNTLIGDDVE